jgi:hypothetical protein
MTMMDSSVSKLYFLMLFLEFNDSWVETDGSYSYFDQERSLTEASTSSRASATALLA